jgi:16S rRNA (guanine1207-N2)-methyltransferase
MGEHYSTPRPSSRRRPAEVSLRVRGLALRLRTDAGVFSRGGLDRGTELLLEALDIGPCELLLDLGCGYGVIGIVAAQLSEGGHVILTDVNERAARLAQENLRANRVTNAEVRTGDVYAPVADLAFNHIVCNPPLRAGRAVVDRIISEAPAHLLEGGQLWLVARTRQGAESLQARMTEAFGRAEIVKRGSGYKVLRATKEARTR